MQNLHKSQDSQESKIKVILFDLDGTLVDTEASAAKTVMDCFSKWKIYLTPEDASYVTGRTWDTSLHYLIEKYRPSVSYAEMKATVLKRYREVLEGDLIAVPGSVDAVQALSHHFRLGLVSGSLREEILWALGQLKINTSFQIILGAEDYPKSKPAPDGYLKAMDFFGVTPSECLIFEDSNAGLRSARTSGAWVVAITSTNHFNQDLSLAHEHIPDLRCIDHKWIQTFSKNHL